MAVLCRIRIESLAAAAQSRLDRTSWRWKLTIPVFIGQGVLAVVLIASPSSWSAMDWQILTEAGSRISAGLNPYNVVESERLRFSPLVAHFFAIIAPIGMAGWTIVSFALLGLVRDWRLIAIFLVALPFWIDIVTGMTFLPVPILAILARRGSFAAGLAFVALAVLAPRPLMLPILGWLLWHDARLRLPAIGIVLGLAAGTLATSWAEEWLADLVKVATTADVRPIIMPALFLGPLWLVVVAAGISLAARGRLGWASLAFAPYWNPSYFMLLILEMAPRPAARGAKRLPGPEPEDAIQVSHPTAVPVAHRSHDAGKPAPRRGPIVAPWSEPPGR